jgi:NDP-sugar pyrophosphorylase family protein
MQAFILAAGLGTRLHPITDTLPKALVEVQGEPLIKIAINNLVHQGATRIVVNIHHFADKLRNYLQSHCWNVDILISDESDLLLDTGGGLKKAEPLFLPNEPILVHNVDILTHLNFTEAIKQHTDSMNLATLVVSQRSTSRQLLFDSKKQLAGWQNCTTGETKWVKSPTTICEQLAFSGIAVIQTKLLNQLPEATHPYSIIPAYLSLAKNHRISYFKHNPADWLDVGKPETLQRAQNWIFNT